MIDQRRIKERRIELGWSQEMVTEQMLGRGFNWSRITVANVEGRGRSRSLHLDEGIALASILGVEPSELVIENEPIQRKLWKLTAKQEAQLKHLLAVKKLSETTES